MLWLSAPVLVEQASYAYLVGLSDTILTGRYLAEEYALAAVTVSTYLALVPGQFDDDRLRRRDRSGRSDDRSERP